MHLLRPPAPPRLCYSNHSLFRPLIVTRSTTTSFRAAKRQATAAAAAAAANGGINPKSLEPYKPDLVLFSDTVFIPPRYPPGEVLAQIAKDYRLKIPATVLQNAFETVLRAHKKSDPLYTGVPVTEKRYEDWWVAVIGKTFNLFRQFGSPLEDERYAAKLRHRCFLNLVNPRSYYMPTDVMALLDRLKAENVPYGVVADSGPHFEKLLRGIDARIKHDSYMTVLPVHKRYLANGQRNRLPYSKRPHYPLIPYSNSSDTGISKPDPSLFLSFLKRLQPKNIDRVYYIGSEPELDYAPAKSIGLKSVLLTRGFEKEATDVKYLSAKKCRLLPYMRVARIAELEKVLFDKKKVVQTEELQDQGQAQAEKTVGRELDQQQDQEQKKKEGQTAKA